MTIKTISLKRFIPGILLTVYSSISIAGDLKPFRSDGCSAFPDGTIEQNSLWMQCCYQHDLAYWRGGTRHERLSADKALQRCVEDVGEPAIAKLMLAGVRVGGTPYLPTTFRWGYGWPYPRGYKGLNDAELAEIPLKQASPQPD